MNRENPAALPEIGRHRSLSSTIPHHFRFDSISHSHTTSRFLPARPSDIFNAREAHWKKGQFTIAPAAARARNIEGHI
jgi:hypothetical protein